MDSQGLSTSTSPFSGLRSAVIGTGGISAEHLSFLSGRTVVGDVSDLVNLIAVCDLSEASARYAATTYGASAYFTDIEEMLDVVRPDVVHILTPAHTHHELAKRCLLDGVHVLCEKPITPSLTQLEELVKIASIKNLRVTESHNYLFNPAVSQLDRAIADGQFGRVTEVEIRITLPLTDPGGSFADPNLSNPIHNLPAGALHDFTTHFASLLLHFAPGVHFDRIAAAWSRHGDDPAFRYDDLDAVVIGEGPNGVVHGRLRFDSRSGPDCFTVRVRGRQGWGEAELFQPHVRIVRPRTGGSKLSPVINYLANGLSEIQSGVRNAGHKLAQRGPYEGLHIMLAETYQALATGSDLPIDTDEMLAVSGFVDRLLESDIKL